MSDDLPVVATFGDIQIRADGFVLTPSGTVPLSQARLEYAGTESQIRTAGGLRTAASLPFIGLGLILAAFGLIALVSGVWLIGLLLVVCGGLAIWAGEYNKKRKVSAEMVTVTTPVWTHYAQSDGGGALAFITRANAIRASAAQE